MQADISTNHRSLIVTTVVQYLKIRIRGDHKPNSPFSGLTSEIIVFAFLQPAHKQVKKAGEIKSYSYHQKYYEILEHRDYAEKSRLFIKTEGNTFRLGPPYNPKFGELHILKSFISIQSHFFRILQLNFITSTMETPNKIKLETHVRYGILSPGSPIIKHHES